MTTRSYRSTARAHAAEQTRARIIAAAIGILRDGGMTAFSLESVAKAAGVSRLTVYNQLGSRLSLLEAVFDEIAASGGLHRIRDVLTESDPRASLDRLVGIFCDFWGGDLDSMISLHAAASGDAGFADSLAARNERRRGVLSVLVRRMVKRGDVLAREARDLVDLLFVLTSLPVFAQLTDGKRTQVATRRLILASVHDAVRRARGASAGSASNPGSERTF